MASRESSIMRRCVMSEVDMLPLVVGGWPVQTCSPRFRAARVANSVPSWSVRRHLILSEDWIRLSHRYVDTEGSNT